MNEIMEWLVPLSASAKQLVTNQSANSSLFIAYFIVCIMIKRSSFLAAFFMSCMLFEMALFDQLSESQLYAITFIIYSYIALCNGLTLKTRLACVIIIILCITLGYDSYFYGIGGAYGARETVVYNNIEYLALYSHICVISTLIPYGRIRNSIRRFIASILFISRNSAYFMPI